MKEESGFEEKRKTPRFKMSSPVEYRMLRGAPETRKGSLLSDISAGGARFITDEFIALTARMVLNVTLPVPERPIAAVSKVAWIRKLDRQDRYEVGNQFLEISKDDKERLASYLGRLSGAPASSEPL
ncbi:MAG: PilZ domain-containing protein [Candidatus Omnitrophica bacterium]|nr:PilZ domain-containing protein [Candidatus Omnitrophota bacterium]